MSIVVSKPSFGGRLINFIGFAAACGFAFYPFYSHYLFGHHRAEKDPTVNWGGFIFLVLPFFGRIYMKVIIVGEGKFYSRQLLTGKKIRLPASDITSVVLNYAPTVKNGVMNMIKKKDKILRIDFRTGAQYILVHQAFQGNFEELIRYFQTNMADKFTNFTT